MSDILVGKTEKEQEGDMSLDGDLNCGKLHGGSPEQVPARQLSIEALHTAGVLRNNRFLFCSMLL